MAGKLRKAPRMTKPRSSLTGNEMGNRKSNTLAPSISDFRLRFFLALLLGAQSRATRQRRRKTRPQQKKPYVIMISFDGS